MAINNFNGTFETRCPVMGDISAVVTAPIVKIKENEEIDKPRCFVTGSRKSEVILLTILNETDIIRKQAISTRYF